METTKRSCGECTACCFALAVPDIQKPGGAWCTHCVRGVGCGVYATRPEACASFQCLWLSTPALRESLRPDRVGFVLQYFSCRLLEEYELDTLMMLEAEEGALGSVVADALTREFVTGGKAVAHVSLQGGITLFFPSNILLTEKAAAFALKDNITIGSLVE